MKLGHWIIMTGLFWAMLCQPLLADQEEDTALPWKRGGIGMSYFLPSLDSEVRVDHSTKGVGAVINLEDSLGLDESLNVWRLDAFYRLGRRNRVYFSFFDLSRDARRVLQQDIEFNGETYQFGTVVDSLFKLRIYKGAYGYSFFQNEHFDVSASFGIYLVDTELGLEGTAGGLTEYQYLTAPLPVFGLRASFAFTPKLIFKQSIEFFWIAIDSYWGRVVDMNMALEYNFWDYLGIGIGYDAFRLEIEADDKEFIGSDFLGTLKFNYGGLFIYAKVCF